ncbi:MAG: hypothetical protein HY040_07995 [Planctomycetes bacterium]|nr:hypothetical protein [Planctomycetota bacterium]
MAGFKLTTDVAENRTYVMTRRAARKLDFILEDKGERAFEATKGNYWMTALFGSVNTYCQFQVAVGTVEGRTEVFVVRNRPVGMGKAIGFERLRTLAKELANAIITEILGAGGKVLDEKEY